MNGANAALPDDDDAFIAASRDAGCSQDDVSPALLMSDPCPTRPCLQATAKQACLDGFKAGVEAYIASKNPSSGAADTVDAANADDSSPAVEEDGDACMAECDALDEIVDPASAETCT